jgi:hypothetical protein
MSNLLISNGVLDSQNPNEENKGKKWYYFDNSPLIGSANQMGIHVRSY